MADEAIIDGSTIEEYLNSTDDDLDSIVESQVSTDEEGTETEETDESIEGSTEEESTEATDENDESEEKKYYTIEEVLEKSTDIDAEFDVKKIKPGSPVEKLYKSFQRGFNKKFEDVANYRKELQAVADVSGLKAQIEELKNKKETNLEEFFEKQKAFEEQKRLQEEEELLPDEVRESRAKSRQLEKELLAMKQDFNYLKEQQRALELERTQQKIDNDIMLSAKENNIDLDKYGDKVKYAIGNTWERDKREGKRPENFTPVSEIIKGLSNDIKSFESSLYSEDKIEEFLSTDKGAELLKKKMTEKIEAIKKKKESGTIIPSNSKGQSQTSTQNESGVPDNINSINFEEYLLSE